MACGLDFDSLPFRWWLIRRCDDLFIVVPTLEIAGIVNDNAMAASTGIIGNKNPSLSPLAGPECSGFSDPSASPLEVAIDINTAVWLIPLNWGLAMELGRLCPRDKAWLGQDSAGGASLALKVRHSERW